jgi:cobalt transporter subunit CbtA
MFKGIVASAALAGALSGLMLTVVQQIEIVPLIRAAEAREAAGANTAPGDHIQQAWTPRDRGERLVSTSIANVVLATAFALLLGAAMSQRRRFGRRAGAVWGIAGYAAFFVAPALGLPPELPGADAAPLADRQLWWIGAASCTAAGLWLAAFAKRPLLRAFGIALLIAPHAVGAPLPPSSLEAATGADSRAFIRATYLANAALWLMLGVVVGVLCKPGKSPVMTGGGHRGSGATDVDARSPR